LTGKASAPLELLEQLYFVQHALGGGPRRVRPIRVYVDEATQTVTCTAHEICDHRPVPPCTPDQKALTLI
jgi:hypothetical protein